MVKLKHLSLILETSPLSICIKSSFSLIIFSYVSLALIINITNAVKYVYIQSHWTCQLLTYLRGVSIKEI